MARHARDPRLELTAEDLFAVAAALSIVLTHMDEAHQARFEALAAKIAAITMRVAEPTQPSWRTRAKSEICAQRSRLVHVAAMHRPRA